MYQITVNTIVSTKEAFDKSLSLCKGEYQKNLIRGIENLSGSSLSGKAKSYSGRYKRSRENLLKRLQDNGLFLRELTGKHNKRILYIDIT